MGKINHRSFTFMDKCGFCPRCRGHGMLFLLTDVYDPDQINTVLYAESSRKTSTPLTGSFAEAQREAQRAETLEDLQEAQVHELTITSEIEDDPWYRHQSSRYSKSQLKALSILRKSKAAYGYGQDDFTESEEMDGHRDPGIKTLMKIYGSIAKEIKHPKYKSVWEAAKMGSAAQVRAFVKKGFDIRRHNENDGGNTVLHYAAAGGFRQLLHYLIRLVRSTRGEPQVRAYVNCIDTAYNKVTPLMEACRRNRGKLTDRLECIRELVEAGADVGAQDASGDNCLHLAVRCGYLPVVRYFCVNTKHSIFASIGTNGKRGEKPIEIAARLAKLEPPYYDMDPSNPAPHNRVEIFRQLQMLLKSANIRMKLDLIRTMQEARNDRLAERREMDYADLMDSVNGMWERSNNDWKQQCTAANKLRIELMEETLADERAQLEEDMESMLATIRGKKRLQGMVDLIQGQEEMAGRQVPFGRLQKMARQQLAEELVESKLRARMEEFSKHNPEAPSWEDFVDNSEDIKKLRQKREEHEQAILQSLHTDPNLEVVEMEKDEETYKDIIVYEDEDDVW